MAHSGYVALIGRPNAGKSTLLNRLVGQKIAAVSDKPQTTRFRIQGVITKPEGQIVLVDTPGVHQPGYELNRRMMASVQEALRGVARQLMRNHLKHCAASAIKADEPQAEAMYDELLDLVYKHLR